MSRARLSRGLAAVALLTAAVTLHDAGGHEAGALVAAPAEYLTLPGTATFTPGTGWTNLGDSGATSSSYQYTADYKTGVTTSTVSETLTSSAAGAWAAVVTTFKPVTCKSGSLTLTAPSSLAFPAVTLTGRDQTATATAALTPSDMTGNAA